MKYMIFAALSMTAMYASAGENVNVAQQNLPDEHYHYSQHLDIAKVVKDSVDDPTAQGVVSAHLVYLDSKGVEHNLAYLIQGETISNG
ncbi:DUF2790 domain-containing protein [Pseudomonas sp. NA-150]|uniref:DUF2790 domain-containing protein n=1 Tax=Pseudomonas sp. NA-150 TaxID=3367525 RepID=UPI0037CC6413